MNIDKKVTLNLVGLNSNAFSLLGAFRNQAKKEHWTKDEIESVTKDAMNGDYDHLLCVLSDHCQSIDDEDEEDDDVYNANPSCNGCGSYLNDDEDGPFCTDCMEKEEDRIAQNNRKY